MAKVIIYSRVSTDRQTLDQQERTVFEWLKGHGMEATHTISDEGVSGGVSYRERNLGRRIIPMLEKGDTLIVSEISRIGRSMSDINRLVSDELKPRGVRLVVVQMGIDLNCADIKALDEMLLFSFAFAAQLEKELIQNRTKSAIEVRRQKLEENGSFVSKKGNVVTHLGNSKGTDMSRANEASAEARTRKAREDKNNLIIWEIIGQGGIPTREETERMAGQLNRMQVRTAKGLEFTADRVRYAYHNLKRIYSC